MQRGTAVVFPSGWHGDIFLDMVRTGMSLPALMQLMGYTGIGVMDTGNYRNRVLNPLAEKLGIPKLSFQILRRTMATRAQKMGSVKDIQAHLRHAKADTTANEHMQELPESVKQMVGSVYAMLSMQAEPCKGSHLLLPNATKSLGVDAVSC
jgi:hypothetical protein